MNLCIRCKQLLYNECYKHTCDECNQSIGYQSVCPNCGNRIIELIVRDIIVVIDVGLLCLLSCDLLSF